MDQKSRHTEPCLEFDVVIVYDNQLTHSASDSNYREAAPFSIHDSYANCNATYKYFLNYCRRQGLRAAFTTVEDITGSGLFRSAWIYTTQWERVNQSIHTDFIFDKFWALAPQHKKKFSLLMSPPAKIELFNDFSIRIVFDDKLKTYQSFPEYTIPTVAINVLSPHTTHLAQTALQKLIKKHPYSQDFTTDLVIKDRFGSGGNNIYKISSLDKLAKLKLSRSRVSFILQPFIDASGFKFDHYKGKTDLRIIIYNNTIIQSYMRIAKPREFRANANQGGQVVYIKINQIPSDVIAMVKNINKILPTANALYALDFIKSKSGHLYFIEGNNSPGLSWFNATDEIRAKELIRLIVQNIKTRL